MIESKASEQSQSSVRRILALGSLLFLIQCRPIPSFEKSSWGYSYDPVKKTCLNDQNELGFNDGEWRECGRIHQAKIENKNLKGANLRGILISDSDLTQVDFSGADLTGAEIIQTKLLGVNFQKADLSSAVLRPVGPVIIQDGGLKGTQIDFDTQAPFQVSEFLTWGAELKKSDLPRSHFVENEFLWSKNLSDEQKRTLQHDFDRLLGLEWDREKLEGTIFENVWGSQPKESIREYIFKGIRVVSPLSALEKRQLEPHFQEAVDQIRSINFTKKILQNGLFESLAVFKQILGKNIQPWVFFEVLGGRRLMPDSGVSGIRGYLRVGPGYLSMTEATIPRIGTLIHESRHSYCPADPVLSENHRLDRREIEGIFGAIASDPLSSLVPDRDFVRTLEKKLEVYDQKYTHLFSSKTCGFDHVQCPKNFATKSLRGVFACESGLAYGSYALEGIFLSGVARACLNCTERERQNALAASVERFSRVLDLEAVLDNRYGNASFEGL